MLVDEAEGGDQTLGGPAPARRAGIGGWRSNFNWGQGAVALERYFTDRPVPELDILLSGTIRPCPMKLLPRKPLPDQPVNVDRDQ